MFGWKTEEVVGTFNPIVPAEKMTEFLGLFNAMLEGGSMLSREVRRQRKMDRLLIFTFPLPH
jgi:hypothetical protein